MRVVYLDTLFFLNLLVDYLLLLLTARIGGRYPRRRRLLAGAAVGAALAVALYFPPVSAWAAALLRLAVCAGTVFAAFGRQPRWEWLRLCGIFTLLTLLLAGIALGLILLGGRGLSLQNGVVYLPLSWGMLAVSFLALYSLSGLVLGKGRGSVSRRYHEIQVEAGGRQVRFRVLEDSGNLLQDPISGKRVIVVQPSALEGLWERMPEGFSEAPPEHLPQLLAQWRQECGTAFWLVPAHTAAQSCMLLAFRPEKLWVDGALTQGYLLGLTARQQNISGDCRGLIGV